MSRIQCNQCGNIFEGNKAKRCPKCGDTFQDEMKRRIRKTIRLHFTSIAIITGVSLAVLAISLVAIDESRHYYWNEPKTEEITDKDTYTYTYTERHTLSSGDDDSPPTYYYDSHTVTNYYFYLNESGKRQVNENTFHKAAIGDNYTYQILHRDWKPGMKDAPIPNWIYIIPVVILLIGLILLQYPIMVKRQNEYNEWLETGDLNVDGNGEE